jgi:hypothetical protein
MLRTRTGVTVLLGAFLLVAAGCSDDDKKPSASESTTTTAAPDTSTTSTAPPSPTTTTATTAPAETTLSAQGYGGLTLGMALAKARSDGLVTNVRPGCEVAGPGQMAADVPGKPDVSVTFDEGRLTNISLRQGATAEGVRVGATIDQAKQTYTSKGFTVTVDNSTVEVFQIITVRVERNGVEVYGFAADSKTRKIDQLDIPHVAFCD